MSNDTTTKLRELAEKAPPGPWVTDDRYPAHVYCDDGAGSCVAKCKLEGLLIPQPSEANAAFIAAANPQAILALLGRLEKAEGERDALRSALVALVNGIGNGSFAHAEASVEFLSHAPQEAIGVINALRAERDEAIAAMKRRGDLLTAAEARLAGAERERDAARSQADYATLEMPRLINERRAMQTERDALQAKLNGYERVREAAMALVAEVHSGNHDARLSLPGEYDTLIEALSATYPDGDKP